MPQLRCERTGDVFVITFDNPAAANALDDTTLDEFNAHLDAIEATEGNVAHQRSCCRSARSAAALIAGQLRRPSARATRSRGISAKNSSACAHERAGEGTNTPAMRRNWRCSASSRRSCSIGR